LVKYVIKRLLQLIPMLLVLSLIVFLMVRMIPGDPVKNMLGIDVPQEMVEIERERLGLNDPYPVQYIRFLGELLRGDLGTSIVTGNPVAEELASRYPNTLILAAGGIVVASIVGILFGILAAVFHNRFWDNFIMALSMLAVSTPSFFLALILMLVFTLHLGWLPSMGSITPQRMVLPIVTLGTQAVGFIARTTRSSMLDIISQDYIRTSRSRGIPSKVIVFSHTLKNAMIPILTAIGLRFGSLLAGSAIVETVFSIKGVGRFVVDSVSKRDYPAVQGCILVLAVTFVVVNTAVDLIYALVDPRIKYE
jgi:ABC-type dipeptide/oligopeptide/nickel transport system permease component